VSADGRRANTSRRRLGTKVVENTPMPADDPAQPHPGGTPDRPEPPWLGAFRAIEARLGWLPEVLPRQAGDPIKPLAIGFGHRLLAMLLDGDPATRKQVRQALRRYCNSAAYLRALAAKGSARWSDDGAKEIEPVSAEHRQHAVAELARRQDRHDAKRRAAANSAAAHRQPVPEPSERRSEPAMEPEPKPEPKMEPRDSGAVQGPAAPIGRNAQRPTLTLNLARR
jgi:sRNA-binding protein